MNKEHRDPYFNRGLKNHLIRYEPYYITGGLVVVILLILFVAKVFK